MAWITHCSHQNQSLPDHITLTRSNSISLESTGCSVCPRSKLQFLFIETGEKCNLHNPGFYLGSHHHKLSRIQLKSFRSPAPMLMQYICRRYLHYITTSSNLNHLSTWTLRPFSQHFSLLFPFFSMISSFDLHSVQSQNQNFPCLYITYV